MIWVILPIYVGSANNFNNCYWTFFSLPCSALMIQVKFGSWIPNLIAMSTITRSNFIWGLIIPSSECMWHKHHWMPSHKLILVRSIENIIQTKYIQIITLRFEFMTLFLSLPTLIRLELKFPHRDPYIILIKINTSTYPWLWWCTPRLEIVS